MKTGLISLIYFLIIGTVCAQSQPDWIYEWNADEAPQPDPNFTFQGVLILKKVRSSIQSRPANGVAYQVGDSIGDAEMVYQGLGERWLIWYRWTASHLINGTTYYYKVFSHDESLQYSPGVETWGTPYEPVPIRTGKYPPNVAVLAGRSLVTLPDVTDLRALESHETIILQWTNPRDTEGWVLSGTDCCSASSGIATLDTITPEGGTKCYYSKAADFKTIDSYTVEFRMRVIESETSEGCVRFRSVAKMPNNSNGVNSVQLDFSKDRVKWALLTPIEYEMDTTDDFHVYRILGGSIGRLYINNKLINS